MQKNHIATAELPGGTRCYAVVDKSSSQQIATVRAATFSQVADWAQVAFGIGELLVFRPFCGDAAPAPIAVTVTASGATKSRSSWSDRKLAPAGFRAMLDERGEWVAATTELVTMLASRGYMHHRIDQAMEWAAGNEAH